MLNLPRNQVQLISFLLFHAGALILIMGGWHNEMGRSVGIALMAGSIWFVMMSESVFLTKVQNEMQQALDGFSRKRECEIQELLYFLKQSQLSAGPFDSWEGAKDLCNKLNQPSFVMGATFNIIKANKGMTDLLGWSDGGLDGIAGHVINDNSIMPIVGEICTHPPHDEKIELSLRYVYLHKSKKRVFGLLSLRKIVDGGFFMIFQPDEHCIIKDADLKKILSEHNGSGEYESAISESE